MDSFDNVQKFLCIPGRQDSLLDSTGVSTTSANQSDGVHLLSNIEEWLQTQSRPLPSTETAKESEQALPVEVVLDNTVNFLDTVNPQKEDLRHHLRTKIVDNFLPLHYNHQK